MLSSQLSCQLTAIFSILQTAPLSLWETQPFRHLGLELVRAHARANISISNEAQVHFLGKQKQIY